MEACTCTEIVDLFTVIIIEVNVDRSSCSIKVVVVAAVTVATTLVVIPVGLVTTVVDLVAALRRARTEGSTQQPMEGTRRNGTKKTIPWM